MAGVALRSTYGRIGFSSEAALVINDEQGIDYMEEIDIITDAQGIDCVEELGILADGDIENL